MVLFSTVLCGVYAAACIKFQFGPWWYNSISLFPIGLFWAAYERQLLVLIRKTYPIFAPLIIILCFVLSHYQEVIVQYLPIPYASALLSNITAIFFGLSIIMVILKCKISNKILNYLGDHSLELYMYHGLFSIWAKPLLNNNRGLFLYAVVVLACSLV
jgi:peptidoglycan/LPS O-acetylase OafA/YrhL